MKKRFFAVALATAMTLSTVMTASAATADADITGGLGSANTGDEVLKGDFDVTYTFNNASYDTSANWNNFTVEVFSGKDYITMRADAFGVGVGAYADDLGTWGDAAVKTTWTGQPGNWAEWATLMADADVEVNVKRNGKVLTFTYKMGSYTMVGTTPEIADLADELNIHLTGEKVKLSNVVFANNTPVFDEEDTTAKNPSAGTEDTEVESTTKNPSAGTEDTEVESTTKNPSAGTEDTETESTTKVETETTENDVTVVPETEAKDVVDAVQKLEDVADDAKVVVGTVDVPKGEKATADVAKLGLAGATKVKVYYMAADGTMQLLGEFPVNADGTIEFDSQGDVKYAFVAVASAEEETTTAKTEETTTAKTEETTAGGDGKTEGTTQTGDSAPVAILAAIATLAGAGVVVSRKKRA